MCVNTEHDFSWREDVKAPGVDGYGAAIPWIHARPDGGLDALWKMLRRSFRCDSVVRSDGRGVDYNRAVSNGLSK